MRFQDMPYERIDFAKVQEEMGELIRELDAAKSGEEQFEVHKRYYALTDRVMTLMTIANIRFDIDEIRIKLADKKVTKATNSQVIELAPVLVLEPGKTFRHGYRNVIVVKKMTFPNDKLLTIEMTEKQISGRNISLNIDYEDILAADSFHADLLEEE